MTIRYALILDPDVVQTADEAFDVASPLFWESFDDEVQGVQAGWTWDGEAFVEPEPVEPPPLDAPTEALIKSPNETIWRVTVDDDGVLTTSPAE